MIITPCHRLPYAGDLLFEIGLNSQTDNSYIEREYADGVFCYTLLNYHDKSNLLVKFDAKKSARGWPPG